MVFTLIMMIVTFSTFFAMCEFGEMVRKQFEIFDMELCGCNWYTFPIELQKLLLAFLPCTQRLRTIQGYADTQCTRDAFKRVNSNFSNFK